MIGLIAVSYHGAVDARMLLRSLQRQTYRDWHLFVVDNSCSDAEWEQIQSLAELDERVRPLRSPKNLGYFGAAHWASAQIDLAAYTWVGVSNTDLEIIGPESLSTLESFDPETVGVVAPSIISGRDGRDQNPHRIRRPTTLQMFPRRAVLGNVVTAQLTFLVFAVRRRVFDRTIMRRPYGERREIYAPHGSVMFVSAGFLRAGGGFGYRLFLFGEEFFIGEQARILGLPVLYVTDVRFVHVEHRQTGYVRSIGLLRHGTRAARYCFRVIKDTPSKLSDL